MSELTQSKHYDFVPIIDREPFKLPDGARVAVMPYINICLLYTSPSPRDRG